LPTLDTIYPIGSVFCNSTNTNPSEIYGGTWELIDKGFKSGITQKNQSATSYLSNFSVASVRGGNTVRLRVSLTTAQSIADSSTVTLGTIDLTQHGLTNEDGGYFPLTVYSAVTMSDGANAVILAYLQTNGQIQIADAFTSGGVHTLPSGTPFYLDVSLVVNKDQMLDSFCDKFYWKRTA
jgi:hypothetical protein